MMRASLLASCIVLAGCASAPPAPPVPALDTRPALAAVRAAGEPAPNELAVRPLVDPAVRDLQGQAAAHEAAGRLDEAVKAVDDALALSPDDPALLQSRAELALARGDLDGALALAARSHAAGPKVGPLCRRQLETRVQVALLQTQAGDAAAAARADAARRERDACTVTPPPRY